MRRLRDIEGGSPLLDKAKAMVEAVEPLEESPARMARVRRRLERADAAAGAGRRLRLPALATAGVIAFFGASAFAAVRYFSGASESDERPAAAPVAPAVAPASPRVSAPAPAPNGETAVEADAPPNVKHESEPPPRHARPTATADRAAARARGERSGAVTRRAHAGSAQATGDNEARQASEDARAQGESHAALRNSERVHRAVQALRRDGNPGLAARLLEEQRTLYPQGPLAEETLSLQIEAAMALGDVRAQGFARSYLARYPNGRYRALAQRALAEPKP